MMSRVELLAWAAGLYEGEGCISFSGCNWQMVVTNADLSVLEKFQDAVGFGRIRVESNRRRPLYRWYVHRSEEIEHVISLLWKHLSERRQDQILDSVIGREKYLSGKTSNRGPARGTHRGRVVHG